MASDPISSSMAIPPLPPTFVTISQALDLTAGQFINVIGYIKDFKPPYKTGGTDWKALIQLTDQSSEVIDVSIFWAEDKIPRVSVAGEVLLIRNVKVQFRGQKSLIANNTSQFHLLKAGGTPGLNHKLWQSWPNTTSSPNKPETMYCSWLNSQRANVELPTDQAFQDKMALSMVPKDKFSLLKDVQPKTFYNILVEVVKKYEHNGIVVLYVSDYTPNSRFYDYPINSEDKISIGQDGDEYGYIKSKPKMEDAWTGPPGKMSIQVSLFDPHARYAKDNIEANDWVRLNNVQIGESKQSNFLEGWIRTDQNINVEKLIMNDEPGFIDPKWKAAVERRREWTKKNKKKLLALKAEKNPVDKRRLVDDETMMMNSKQRRKQKRAAALRHDEEPDINVKLDINLNDSIVSIFPELPIVPLKQFLNSQVLAQTTNGVELVAPFSNIKCKACVRVVDYFPPNIEDFAFGRRPNVMDMLSDCSSGEGTDLEEDMRRFKSGKGFGEKKWEWRFSLQVEDASLEDAKERIWLMVDNASAQMLLNLEDDATNLRKSPELLLKLKEQLFKLWGELEEEKSVTLKEEDPNAKRKRSSSVSSMSSSPPKRYGQQPDADSGDDSTSIVPQGRDSNSQTKITSTTTKNVGIKNKAFICCIQQYGVKVEERNANKANAGDGQRWQRMCRLIGTKIT